MPAKYLFKPKYFPLVIGVFMGRIPKCMSPSASALLQHATGLVWNMTDLTVLSCIRITTLSWKVLRVLFLRKHFRDALMRHAFSLAT